MSFRDSTIVFHGCQRSFLRLADNAMNANRVRQLNACFPGCHVNEYILMKMHEDPELNAIRSKMEDVKYSAQKHLNMMGYADLLIKGQNLRDMLAGRSKPECIPFEGKEQRYERTFIRHFKESVRDRSHALEAQDEVAKKRAAARARRRRYNAGIKRKYDSSEE